MMIQLPQSVDIERSPQFMINSQELGDFIRALPLSTEQDDTLVKLIIKQITEAEITAFKQGFSQCAELMKEGAPRAVRQCYCNY